MGTTSSARKKVNCCAPTGATNTAHADVVVLQKAGWKKHQGISDLVEEELQECLHFLSLWDLDALPESCRSPVVELESRRFRSALQLYYANNSAIGMPTPAAATGDGGGAKADVGCSAFPHRRVVRGLFSDRRWEFPSNLLKGQGFGSACQRLLIARHGKGSRAHKANSISLDDELLVALLRIEPKLRAKRTLLYDYGHGEEARRGLFFKGAERFAEMWDGRPLLLSIYNPLDLLPQSRVDQLASNACSVTLLFR